MKNLKCNLLVLLLTSWLVSCNEKVSEEINNSTSVQNNSEQTKFKNKGIRLVHKMDADSSYLMHKMGSLSSACEVKSPALGFDADDYNGEDQNYAIDCVLDVQELDLYFEGMKIEMQVDENLCEYIEYKPFKFLNYKPGATQRTLHNIECDAICAEKNPSLCGKYYAKNTVPVVATRDYDPTDFDDFEGITPPACKYDYTEQSGPNCDSGSQTIITYMLTGDDDPDLDPDTDDASCNPTVPGEVQIALENRSNSSCGASDAWTACMEGPALDEFSNGHQSSIIYPNTDLSRFTKEISYDGNIENSFEYATNMKLANFSRICSDTTSNKVADSVYETLVFNGYDIENFSSAAGNKSLIRDFNGDGLIDGSDHAENPFRSIYNTSPYYGIYCLDKAYDIKAQIRLFVRESDKEISTANTYLSKVSDIAQGANASLDARWLEQAPGFYWNNKKDWDDFYEQDNDKDGVIDELLFDSNRCRTLIKTGSNADSDTPLTDVNFPNGSL